MSETNESLNTCFSCGKPHPEVEMTLSFGWGSKMDLLPDAKGWVCDECVVQKGVRLSIGDVPLPEDEGFSVIVRNLDHHGRRRLPAVLDREGDPMTLEGVRESPRITSEERSQIEGWLVHPLREEVDPDLVAKLLTALSESEARRYTLMSQLRTAEMALTDRARAVARRLTADEYEELLALENEDVTPAQVGRLREHLAFQAKKATELKEEVDELSQLHEELTSQIAALGARLRHQRR